MKNILLVFAGSGVGGVLRYLAGRVFAGMLVNGFPLATFLVNIAACFIIGILMGLGQSRKIISPSISFLLATGFCGGLSTFSTFSAESIQLLERGNYGMLAIYILASVIGCAIVTYTGLQFTK